MNTLPSDPDEHIIDIFVLSGSPEGAPQLKSSLEEAGYRVTLFSDGSELTETLRSGIPNLLICDATTEDERGYDLCRQLKADDNLWMIPVLILTRTNGLSDLLRVLDCNADNFIPYPADTGFLLSQIDGTLSSPVERQTPELVKTQFRIQHDGHVYLVTADRRKLLELLLSSFESTVGFSSELAEMQNETRQLSSDLTGLRDALADQNGKIARMNEVLRQKEQNEQKIARTLGEREAALAEKTGEIERLMKSIDDDRALISSAEEHIRLMLAEKEELTGTHRAMADSHQQTIASLSAELGSAKADLDNARAEIAEKAGRIAIIEKDLSGITWEKEEADRAITALSADVERLRTALASERERAEKNGQDLAALGEAKARTEEDLGGKIAELTERLDRNSAEAAALNVRLGTETARADSASAELAALRETAAADGETHRAALGQWEAERSRLQAEIDSVTGVLEHERSLRAAAESKLAETAREKEDLEREIREQSTGLDNARNATAAAEDARRGLEENLAAVSADRKRYEESYRQLSGELEQAQSALDEEKALSEDLEERRSAVILENEKLEEALRSAREEAGRISGEFEQELKNARGTIEAAESRVQALEDELAAARAAVSDAEEEARKRAEALARAQSALAAEQEQRRSDAENLRGTVQSIESASLELRNAISERDHERELLATTRDELATVKREKEFLEAGLREISHTTGQADQERSGRIAALESELALARKDRERLEAELAGLREERSVGEKKLSALSSEIQQARTALADEWEDHMNADEQLQVAEKNNVQLQEAEKKLSALASELDQARAALADEWEDHMNARERLAAADVKNEELRQSISGDRPAPRGSRSIIVRGDSSLPVTIAPKPTVTARVDMPPLRQVRDESNDRPPAENPGVFSSGEEPSAPGPGAVTAANVPLEDLFEETGTGTSAAAPSAVSPGRGPHAVDESPVAGEDDVPLPDSMEISPEEPADETSTTGIGKEMDEPEEEPGTGAGYEPAVTGLPEPGSVPAGGISFDRQQWLGLFSWARHAEGLTGDQRREIMRMGRLVQRGRRLTKKQEERVREMLSLVHSLGYQFS